MGSTSEFVTDSGQSGGVGTARFVIDAKRSRFTVQALVTGILSAMGHNPTIGIRAFSGEVEFNPDAPEANRLRLSIQSDSLSVQDDVSDKDRREIERLMKTDVLEVEKYPEIRYQASATAVTRLDKALYSVALSGDLSFHGVTRKQSLTVRVSTFDEMLRASGDFTMRQSDYQIKPVSVAGGALKLKDELKFSFEIIARMQAT
jgi:polyisoprenoid-binding protein YceI